MSLTPAQEQDLREIGEHLATSDPALARRLAGHAEALGSGLRELVVLGTVLVCVVVGFLPLAVGLALANGVLLVVGVLTAVLGIPLATAAIVARVHRR